jgi:hypothetical protein
MSDEIRHNRFIAKTRDGPLSFQKDVIVDKSREHLDNIRRLVTEIEFEDELDEAEAARAIEILLQKIEGEIDAVRVLKCNRPASDSESDSGSV